MSTVLSKKRKELDHQESIIQDGLKSFRYVGEALRKIRDEELYVEEHETFENYCKSRWNFPRQRAYQFIETAETVCAMSKIFDTTKAKITVLPEVESHAAALTQCADDAETRAKVWKAVVDESAEKPITAAVIKKKADEILPPKIKETKPAKAKQDQIPASAKPVEVVEQPKVDSRTSFNPEDFDPELKKDKTPDEILKVESDVTVLIAKSQANLKAAFESMGPIVRAIDAANAAKKVPNHKSLLEHQRRLNKELEEANTTMIQFERAWRFRK